MAKYKSIVEISGSIDDLVFYNLNGVPVVRKKSGFNKNDYKNNPKYERVRENSGEFGHCSKSGKMIRLALGDYLKDCGDQYMYQKFAKIMTQIKDLDKTSPRGKRNIPEGLNNEGAYGLLHHFRFGAIDNLVGTASRMDGLFGIEIKLKSPALFDEMDFIILKPDFVNYVADITIITKPITSKQALYEFEKNEENEVLYFLVLKKDNKILNLGFI